MDEITELLNDYAENNNWKPGAKYRALCKFIAEQELFEELEEFLQEGFDEETEEPPTGRG